MPRRVVMSICALLLITTILIVGLLYRSDINEATDLTARYNQNTQQFDRTNAVTIIEEIKHEENETGDTTTNPLIPTLPGVPVVNIPTDLSQIIMMSDEEIWSLCTGGRYTTKPTDFKSVESELKQCQKEMETSITFNVWDWDGTSMTKVSKTRTLYCNRVIAPLLEKIFAEIYAHPDKPVINDIGCYNVRAVSGGSSPSAHAFGCAVDINPTAAAGDYGNGLHMKAPTKQEWDALPDSRGKQELVYEGGPVATAFKRYGFEWGGDFNSRKDNMHFSFIGDNKRSKGQSNYKAYGGK